MGTGCRCNSAVLIGSSYAANRGIRSDLQTRTYKGNGNGNIQSIIQSVCEECGELAYLDVQKIISGDDVFLKVGILDR